MGTLWTWDAEAEEGQNASAQMLSHLLTLQDHVLTQQTQSSKESLIDDLYISSTITA
jgi:hypothetical protein